MRTEGRFRARWIRPGRRGWRWAPLLVAAAACGPSIQSIHEGSVRFEHCYRLDLDPKIAPSHRHACWEQWLKIYSYGQSRDRLEHAQARLRAIEFGDPNPPSLNLTESEEREARQFYMSTPAPVNVHAPPPPVAAPAPEPLAPGDTCVADCRKQRAECLKRCDKPAEAEGDAVDRKTKPTEPTPAPKHTPPAGETEQEAKESTAGECQCERDYKICGARCFE